MNAYIYNGSLIVGLALVGAGAGLVSIPAGLVSSGGLLIILTIYGAEVARKRQR